MSKRICVISGPYEITAGICSGLAAFSKQHASWRIEVHTLADATTIDWLCHLHYAGYITVTSPEAEIKHIVADKFPVVSVIHDHVKDGATSVVLDDEAIGALAANHLVESGYRHIGYYGVNFPWSMDRFRGVVKALREHRMDCFTNAICEPKEDLANWPEWFNAINEERMAQWLKAIRTPAAVVVFSDQMARILVDVCETLKIRIPEDLAIIGVDNVEAICESNPLTLSSVDPDIHRVGYMAGKVLYEMLEHPQPTRLVKIPPRAVVQRRSTNLFAHDDSDVAAAMRFIKENSCTGESFNTFYKKIHVSRRQLERKFKAQIGRTPGEEILQLRMQRACELLTSTNYTLAEIADRCGYAHLSSFSAAFRMHMNMPPRDYRKANMLT